jgi:formate-dependent nitrite reductase membrane component NrfD
MALGLAVAAYTGFLLASSRGIALWNSPALPILFVVSGFSTGAALLMLYLVTLGKSPFGRKAMHALGRLDIGLIAAEIVVLFAFANMAWFGSAGMQHGMDELVTSAGFIIGVPIAGLIAPLVLETWGMKWRSTTMPMTAAASVLVLVGGVLLRVYILQAGYFAFPWSQ